MNLYDYLMSMDDNEYYAVYDEENQLVVGGTIENILNEIPKSFLETYKVYSFSAIGGYYKVMVK